MLWLALLLPAVWLWVWILTGSVVFILSFVSGL